MTGTVETIIITAERRITNFFFITLPSLLTIFPIHFTEIIPASVCLYTEHYTAAGISCKQKLISSQIPQCLYYERISLSFFHFLFPIVLAGLGRESVSASADSGISPTSRTPQRSCRAAHGAKHLPLCAAAIRRRRVFDSLKMNKGPETASWRYFFVKLYRF